MGVDTRWTNSSVGTAGSTVNAVTAWSVAASTISWMRDSGWLVIAYFVTSSGASGQPNSLALQCASSTNPSAVIATVGTPRRSSSTIS